MTSGVCKLCHLQVEGIERGNLPAELSKLYPSNPLFTIPNAFDFISEGVALLHHECKAMQANTDTPYWQTALWWACLDPLRPLDDDACFDVHCIDCARRWHLEHSN